MYNINFSILLYTHRCLRLREFRKVQVSFVKGQGNRFAHLLAQHAKGIDGYIVWIEKNLIISYNWRWNIFILFLIIKLWGFSSKKEIQHANGIDGYITKIEKKNYYDWVSFNPKCDVLILFLIIKLRDFSSQKKRAVMCKHISLSTRKKEEESVNIYSRGSTVGSRKRLAFERFI